jgi:serine phosphatase RsbU (regulator of sigma subunit)
VIADVAGKGYPAALTVANLQAMLHALANGENISLLDAATYINQSLRQSLQGGRFVTLFMAELNYQAHDLQWINAGHIPPLLWHKDSITHLEATSPPLGMLESIHLHVETTKLEIGDTLFACTDGITEARNANNEMFGDKNVEAWFKLRHALDPAVLPSSMLACLDEKGFHTRDDDITMLCLKRSNDE